MIQDALKAQPSTVADYLINYVYFTKLIIIYLYNRLLRFFKNCFSVISVPLFITFNFLYDRPKGLISRLSPSKAAECINTSTFHYTCFSLLKKNFPHHYDLCVCMLSHIQLCDTMNCRPPGLSGHGIFQARRMEWVAISYFRRSS